MIDKGATCSVGTDACREDHVHRRWPGFKPRQQTDEPSGGKMLGNLIGARGNDTLLTRRRVDRRSRAVHAQAGVNPNGAQPLRLFQYGKGPQFRLAGHVQAYALVVAQVLWLRGASCPTQVVWRRAKQRSDLTDATGRKAGVRKRREPDGHVHAVPDQVHKPVGKLHPYRHAGMRIEESLDQWQQMQPPEQLGSGDPDRPMKCRFAPRTLTSVEKSEKLV